MKEISSLVASFFFLQVIGGMTVTGELTLSAEYAKVDKILPIKCIL